MTNNKNQKSQDIQKNVAKEEVVTLKVKTRVRAGGQCPND